MVRAIGIDFGTTNVRAAYWNDAGHVEILPNDLGEYSTANFVAFRDGRTLIGDEAKGRISFQPGETNPAITRLLGKTYDDSDFQLSLQSKPSPFNLSPRRGSWPTIMATHCGESIEFAPEEIASMVLSQIQKSASQHLGETVTNAVISVPTQFNLRQRLCVIDAATLAGLNVLRVIGSTSAIIAHHATRGQMESEVNVLILSIGGGYTDATIASMDGGIVDVNGTAGSQLGGEDFDERLVTHLFDLFQKKHNKDARVSLRAVRRLQLACETAKRTLSSSNQTTILLESFFEGVDLNFVITRDELETLCQDLFQSCLDLVVQAIRGAKIDKDKVAEVILRGETSRIPRFRVLLTDYFGTSMVFNTAFQGDAAVRGAAAYGAMQSGHIDKLLNDLIILDTVSEALGVETVGNVITPIIRRNSPVPAAKEEEIQINVDAEPALHIYQSEMKGNNFLFSLPLPGIEISRGEDNRGVAQIRVKFDLDTNMKLSVTVTFLDGTNRRVKGYYHQGKTGAEIHQMMIRLERLKEIEQEFQQSSTQLREWLRSYSDRLGAAALGQQGRKDVFGSEYYRVFGAAPVGQQEGLEFDYSRVFGAAPAGQQGRNVKEGLQFTIEEKNIIRRAVESLNEFLGHSGEASSVEECRQMKEKVERVVNPVLIAASHRHLGISPAPWGNASAMEVDM